MSSGIKRDETLKAKIAEQLKAEHVDLVDESDGCGSKYNCVVVSGAFEGKSRLDCHRLVHEAVGEDEMAKIHAFSVKTYTPEKWKAKQ